MYLIECSDDYCKSMYYKPVPGDRFSCQWDVNKTYNYTKDKTLALLYNDLEVAEIIFMKGSGHGGSVVGNADKFESLFLGGGNHFPQGAVSVNTGDGMGMDIEQI